MKDAYASVIEFLETVYLNEPNEMGAKASGILKEIRSFDFAFYVYTLEAIFNKTSVLHKSLQSRNIDISKAIDLVEITIKQLIEMKNDTKIFQKHISCIKEFANGNDIEITDVNTRNKKRKRRSI